jgi:hypothetical protein
MGGGSVFPAQSAISLLAAVSWKLHDDRLITWALSLAASRRIEGEEVTLYHLVLHVTVRLICSQHEGVKFFLRIE